MSQNSGNENVQQQPDKVEVDPRAINAYVLYAQGVKTKAIASVYGVTQRTVQRWIESLKDSCHDMAFADIEAAKKRLQGLTPMALDTLEDFVTKQVHRMTNPSQALKAAEYVLKTFDIVKDKSTVTIDVTDMTDEELLQGLAGLSKGKNE